ncbi:MAG TPA: amidohydrolase [Thermomicrobiales bacterium]|nr:amidohydrolase [Thermomicrobiales bacterium]
MRGQAPAGVYAEAIYTGGQILTCDLAFGVAEALAVRDGCVLAVGADGEIAALAGPGTRREALAGRTVLPGLIDAHCHVLATGLLLGNVQLYDCRSIDDILEKVAARARETPPGAWIVGRGWDESLLAERRHPTRHELDRAAPEHPVCLHRVWNKLVANSRALAAAGITRATPDPDPAEPYAGSFERDEHGEPTGLFRDRAKDLITRHIPPDTVDDMIAALGRVARAFNAVGLVGAADPGLYPDDLRAYQQARDDGALTLRAALCLAGWGFGTAAWEPRIKPWVESLGVHGDFGDDRLWLDAVKFMVDGGIGDRTAAVSAPYEGSDDRGRFIVPPEELPALVRWCHDRGWSVESHTCGDRAQDAVVAAYAAAYDAPGPRLRHRVHHAYLPTPGTLDLMARHRIPAILNPPFLYYMGDSFVASLGAARADRMKPARTYLDAGVPLAGSSDSTVSDYNPFVGIATMVLRRTLTGHALDQGERLSREEAIRLYTSGAAYALRRERAWGSLEPGKWADFVVLDRDILTCPDEEIAAIRPLRTVLGGATVYEA